MADERKPDSPVNRRTFLQTSAVAGAALGLSAVSYGKVLGANERIGIAFLGVGGRGQAHLDVISRMRNEGKPVAPVAVCDVWDGQEDEYDQEFGGKVTRRRYAQGLYPSARRIGLKPDDKKHVTKDYRRLLELAEVDVVCIATPDHWHAKMAIDAAAAGKHVFCEKPISRTPDEAHAIVDAMLKCNAVMTVGIQSLADPSWQRANEFIRQGKVGHVSQAQTGVYRNDIRGQWRYYRLTVRMNPNTIDWRMFLGSQFEVVKGIPLAPELPFDRAAFAQWRCHWSFSGGPFTDLLAHQAAHMLAALGVRYPRRVTGAGGIFVEYDGREVPDVATVVADFEEGCQLLLTANLVSSYPVEEAIRGRLGTIKFVKGGFQIIRDDPTRSSGLPARLEKSVEPAETVSIEAPANLTYALWENFLQCVRKRERNTFCPPELAAAALTTVALGQQSYRAGQVLFWNKEMRQAMPNDPGWAAAWEKRSRQGVEES
jgi:predicted dehydrogenase